MSEKLKLEMHVKDTDYTQASLAWLKFNKLFIVLIICMAALYIGSCVYLSLTDEEHNPLANRLGFIGLGGFFLLFLYVLTSPQSRFKLSRKYLGALPFIEMDKHGFEISGKGVRFFWDWDHVIAIRETKNFIFISVWRATYTIYKEKLDADLLGSLQDLLRSVPVEKKKLLINRK